jgi:adenine/guanine phosphoribosyltransferase-like PRPP-binding protein
VSAQPTTHDGIWDLLAAGGVTRGGDAPAPYRPLRAPSAASELVTRFARVAREAGADLVLVWDDLDQVVLGQLLAAQLGVGVARAYDADGLVAIRDDAPLEGRVLLVTDALRDPRTLAAMRGIIEQRGSIVAGIAVLVATDELRKAAGDAPVHALAEWGQRAGGAG